jgi:hypothetical protein
MFAFAPIRTLPTHAESPADAGALHGSRSLCARVPVRPAIGEWGDLVARETTPA